MKTINNSTFKIGAVGVGLALLTSVASFMWFDKEEEFKGKIVKESFYPQNGFLSIDRYTALIRAPKGNLVTANHYNGEAREMDLRYNEGDEVTVREIPLKLEEDTYKIK